MTACTAFDQPADARYAERSGVVMPLSPHERDDIRRTVHAELTEIEQMCSAHGTYTHLCECGGLVFLAHRRVGHVLRQF